MSQRNQRQIQYFPTIMFMHILFFGGIIATITGWFLENAREFKWVMLKIAPRYIFAQSALDDLEKNPKIVLMKSQEGFNVLLENWSNLKSREKVEYIGRSAAFISFGSQVKNDIQLIAYDSNKNEIAARWSLSEAREGIEKFTENKLFKIGAYLFWGGILLAIIAYLISV